MDIFSINTVLHGLRLVGPMNANHDYGSWASTNYDTQGRSLSLAGIGRPMLHGYGGTVVYYIFLVSIIVIINIENICRLHRDFPGGPVVKTLHFHCRGCSFDPSSAEIRSHMICGGTRKIKNKQTKKLLYLKIK